MTSSLSPQPALASLTLGLRERLWSGASLPDTAGSVSSGFAALDAQLPGRGWPRACLTELLLPAPGIGEIRLLAPCLAALTQAQRHVILVLPETGSQGLPYPDGWTQLGIDLTYLLMIRTERPRDRLWAIEQSLRSAACGALLAWLPQAAPQALRRFQLAASGAPGPSFLLRPVSAGAQPSAAPLRLVLNRPAKAAPGRFLRVEILKRRGPVLDQAVLVNVPDPRPLRSRVQTSPAPVENPAVPVAPPGLAHHALGRTALSDAATGSHPAPAA